MFVPLKDSLEKISSDSLETNEADAIIEYSAKDSAILDVKKNQLNLYGDAELKFKEYNLKAAKIIYYRDDSMLEAYGVEDSTGKYVGLPIFMDGDKKYEAFSIRYNVETKKGTITMGSTEIEGGYYLGEKIKKVDEGTFFIKNGRYTTCDKDDPHFYFGSPRMKVLQGDKVVAEPVYLFIDDVPIFALPFGIFPNHSGRSSGLIPPAYGEDATFGRYLSHLGYFLAINDYTDIALQGNYFTKGRLDLNGRFRYALRYKFTGSVDVGGTRVRIGEATDVTKDFRDEWKIGVNHSQTIDPTTNLSANVNFLSSKGYYDNTTNNFNNLLLQNAVSNVTLSKVWEGTPHSVTVNYSRDQNLVTGEVTQTIPYVNFLRSQTFPFRTKNTSLLNLKWYESISFSYNALANGQATKLLNNDTTITDEFVKDYRAGLKQFASVSAPIKISEFNFTPFFNYNEIWYNKSSTQYFDSTQNKVIVQDVNGFKAFRFFNTGVSLNTRLVGIFNTRIFGIKGIRHLITPSITYSYQPDFSKPKWNAWGTYIDRTGNEQKYSFYTKEVFGGAPSGESQSIGFGLSNVFEMKVRDTDSTDTKFQLLNLNANIGYNFVADSLKFSELGLDYRTGIGNLLNISGGARFNLYKYVDGVGRINKFLIKEGKLAQLTNFSINLSTSFQGGQETEVKKDSLKKQTKQEEYIGIYNDEPVDFSIPWSFYLNYNYTIDQIIPSVITKFSNVSGNLAFSLTKNWKFTASAGYDIFQKQFTAPYVTIYRDLHCWEMSLNWVPTGSYRGYRFEIRVKAPQLQDVKITKQSNFRGVF